ncbi:MAG: tripartite tricarboxylate transporter permease [Candidatus Undinarchaeales archaeon]|nr:tripartite tricarboxylate transporter permease [Candidatus Undinarchaeales archaeon]
MLWAIALGLALGTVTGLVPGIHVNLVSLMVNDRLAGDSAVPVLVAMATVHTFLDFIPSVLLGIPDEATALSVLPAHKYALEGRAVEAYFLTVVGGFSALLLSLLLLPVFFMVVPAFYARPWIATVLVVGTILVLILTEQNRRGALAVLLLAAFLGQVASDVPESLFPMLSGMFGVSTLLLSLVDAGGMPHQETSGGVSVGWGDVTRGTVAGTLSGALVGMVPGVGNSQACLVSSLLVGGTDRTLLVSMGAVNTANFIFNMVTLSLVGKARSGVAIAVQEAAAGADVFRTSLVSMVLAASLAAAVSLTIFSQFVRIVGRLDYRILTLSIVSLVTLAVAWRCGPAGLALLAASTALGVVPPTIGVKRSLCMGCIMVPVAVSLLGRGIY